MIDLDVHLSPIVHGDREAFGRWLAGAEHSLRARLRSFAATVDVEAVLQEALLRTWQFAPRVRPDGRPNTLLRFAAATARNFAISQLRRDRPPPDDPPEPIVEPLEPDPLLARLFQLCLRLLPPQPLRAFLARFAAAGGKDDATLARENGMRPNTFLQNVTRARRLLQRCLASKGYEMEATP